MGSPLGALGTPAKISPACFALENLLALHDLPDGVFLKKYIFKNVWWLCFPELDMSDLLSRWSRPWETLFCFFSNEGLFAHVRSANWEKNVENVLWIIRLRFFNGKFDRRDLPLSELAFAALASFFMQINGCLEIRVSRLYESFELHAVIRTIDRIWIASKKKIGDIRVSGSSELNSAHFTTSSRCAWWKQSETIQAL